MRKLLGAVCCVFAAGCAPKEAGDLEGDERPVTVLPRRAHKEGVAATGAVTFEAPREAIAPLTLREARVVEAAAAEETTVTLPVDFSTQGVWARVALAEGGTLEVDGVQQRLDGESLVFFPVQNKTLRFRSPRAQTVTLSPVATNDSLGGGFDPTLEAPQVTQLVAGGVKVADALAGPDVADDTFAKLTRLELRAATDVQVLLGRCAPAGATPQTIDTVLEVKANAPLTATRWLYAGDLCAQASAEAELTTTVFGRVRRFSEQSLRPVRPLAVLDTSTGVGGWKGAPTASQALDFSLASLTGLDGATHALLRVSSAAPVAIGPCGAQAPALAPGSYTLVDLSTSLCAAASADVNVTLTALVTARSEAPGVCGARPPPAACEATTLLGKLRCLPGVTAEPYDSPRKPHGSQQYLLRVTQPVDHFRPDGATFTQRALLTVRDEAAPVVLHTTGYELFEYFSDVSRHFETNELELEHRFFEDSTPDPLDRSTLTIMQSAWDSHRVVELVSPLFPGAWLNTGHSKGGMTALYHRRFFPCDVAASAPYVMPLSLGRQDPRYGPWLAALGGPGYQNCRQTFVDVDTSLISRRDELAPTLRGTYTRVGSRVNALWLLTGSSLWSIFQSGLQDDRDRGCPAWEPLRGHPQFNEYIAQYAGYGESFADEVLAQQVDLNAYSYQTQNELGAPGSNRAHLEQFGIPALPDENQLSFPLDVPVPAFEARAMPDVQRWLKRHGERFFFLYGGYDPWTGGKVDVDGARDTLLFIVPGASHGVSIEDLANEQREDAYQRIEAWLGARRLPKRQGKSAGDELPSYRDFMHRHRL